MTIVIQNEDLWLLPLVPFLLVCAVFMTAGLVRGPDEGGFKLVATWPWLLLLWPSVVAGLVGIWLAVSS